MSQFRKVKKVFAAVPVTEGAGVKLRRAFGGHHVPLFDPFLLFDDFRGDRPEDYTAGFPWHPHRGIETITYVLEGTVEHGDSMGNSGSIGPGDVQWMTAGSGIIHQEMPKGNSAGRMGGFQLWANLPRSSKMIDPRYRDVTSNTIPRVRLSGGVEIGIICGRIGDTEGPVRDIVIDPEYLDITIPPDGLFTHPVASGHTVFAYIIEGHGFFCETKKPFSYDVAGESYFDMKTVPYADNRKLVLFDEGDAVSVSTEAEGVRFLLVSGRPLGEPVAWYGPVVMNTQDELKQAFDEYAKGTFVKHVSH